LAEAATAAVVVLAEATVAGWAAIVAGWAAIAAALLEGGGAAVAGRAPVGVVATVDMATVDMGIEEATADMAATDIPSPAPQSVLASATQLRRIRMATAMAAIPAAARADIERSKA